MPVQQTLAQARVVDPILSDHARGFRQAQHIGRALFPLAPVPSYGGKVIEFDKSSFKVYNSKRAPGSNTKRISFGYEGKPYAIVPSALEAQVPREWMRDASHVPGINLATRAVNTVMRSMELEHEVACAAIATNVANYDANHRVALVGADAWLDPTSDPAADVDTGKEAIRGSVGLYPNTLMLPATAYRNLKANVGLVARSADSGIKKVNLDLLRSVFEIENIVVGAAVVAADDDAFSDVWGTSAVLAYVSPGAGVNANMEEPGYAYTYLIEGHPMVETPYWDNNSKSWVYGVSYDNTPVLSGMTAGYLIQGAG